MKILRLFILLLPLMLAMPLAAERTYYVLDGGQGLRGRSVLQMLQLSDGRMVVMTESHVNIYDGAEFRSVAVDTSAAEPLEAYYGPKQATGLL